jgi:C-terminal processing protease CtpA/Prc
MHKKIFALLAFTVFVFAFSHTNVAQTKKKSKIIKLPRTVVTIRDSPTTKLKPEQKRRLDAFEEVWTTINENYFDQTFNGLDWNKIRAEYLTKLKTVKTDETLHVLLQEMINRLNRSHFFIVPPEAYKEIEEAKAESQRKEREKKADEKLDDKKDDEVEEKADDENQEIFDHFGLPIDVRILEDKVVITNILKDSNVDKAGLKIGYVIEKINGISLKEFMFRLQNYNAYSKTLKHQMPSVLLSFMEGEENSEVELTYADDKDAKNGDN